MLQRQDVSMQQSIRFSRDNSGFQRTLNQRVHQYFKEKGISRHGGMPMRFKTFVMFGLYFTPIVLIISGVVTNGWLGLLCALCAGIGLAGIGLSVMHDACHGSYSSKDWENKLFSYSLNMLGASSFNWKIQHNVLHHSFTNVLDHDEDIDNRGLFRFSPHAPFKPIHRWQYLYAWPFYSLMTIFWVLVKDFARFNRYQKTGLVKQVKANYIKELAIMWFTKLFYISYALVLPMVFSPFSVGQVILGFLVAHLAAGFLLALVFQPAHVAEEAEFVQPGEGGELPYGFAEHQVRTTRNFANENRLFSWYAGGLNFQIEHHLFPHVCHVHYRNLAPIVKQTAEEFGIPYHATPGVWKALVTHGRHLKNLGAPNPAVTSTPVMAGH